MNSSENDGFNFKDVNLEFLEELSNQFFMESELSDIEIIKLLKEANQPSPNILFDDEDARKILENISSSDSEFNFGLSEIDLSELIQNNEENDNEPELISEINSSITTKDVAAWMLNQVNSKKKLYQSDAVWNIKKYFGDRFIYLNENHNSAISREVLKEFLSISLKTVVWNKRERYWRPRQPSDHVSHRTVDD